MLGSFRTALSYVVIALMIGAPVAAIGSAAGSAAATHVPTLGTAQLLGVTAGTTKAYSTNWAGYAITKGSVTDVQGSWVQPKVSCPSPTAYLYSSVWVGIDGDGSNTVEQTGTSAYCEAGVAVYSAWYEFYPAAPVTISWSVAPGDHMTASVSASGTSFTAKITDVTTGNTKSVTKSVSSATRHSAEWIVEAPYSNGVLPLAHFSKVTFTSCNATLAGSTHTISGWANQKLIMVNNAGTMEKALPGALSRGGSTFSVKWVSSGP